ncbi:isoflavone 3'-hydroxylase-like [Iris pallida]|uniref:Isoflavone 3'-hydroxylase-like n=1 Tax=Iris pallida TaxID=29817 RepID=A0AAX6EMA2_IRIPA|nr:isoflavone 3'-hydroxylase-like [Iris pallida]
MEDATILYFLSSAVLFAAFLQLLRSGRKRVNLPPSGPYRLPIIGHLHHILSSPLPLHQTLARLASDHGPVLLLRFGSRPVLVVSSPSAAEECLAKNDVVFANRPRLLMGKHLSYNYTNLSSASYGPYWRNLRRFSTLEIFSSARTAALSSLRAGEVRAMLRQLFRSSASGGEQSCSVDMHVKFAELTTNMMMQMIAGRRYYGESGLVGVEEGLRFRRIIEEAFYLSGASNPEDYLPVMKWLGINPLKKRMVKLEEEIDELLQDMVDDQRRHYVERQRQGEEKKTLVHVMLSLQEKDPQFYTDVLIKGTILMLITAGTDTSAGTMEWVLSLLLNHPEVLKKVRAEMDTHVGHDRLLADSDLPNLPYLHNVIKETLRLFPAGPLLAPHESSTECNVAGYDIPRGTMLLVNVYAIHRDPDVWEDPTSFRPERFEGDGAESKGFKHIPFGFGRRGCPGELVGTRIMGLALGSLIQCFEWERVGSEEVDLAERKGLVLPKAVPLVAMYKPRKVMMELLSRL